MVDGRNLNVHFVGFMADVSIALVRTMAKIIAEYRIRAFIYYKVPNMHLPISPMKLLIRYQPEGINYWIGRFGISNCLVAVV